MPNGDSSARPGLVLIADDQEWTARSMQSIIAPHGYAVVTAFSGTQALALAESTQPDAVIVDTHLSDISGIEVCRRLARRPDGASALPILMTTSAALGREERLAAFEAGAWDLCTQPIDAEVLLLKLATYIRARREITHVREESLYDADTGLYSARGLRRRVRELGAAAQRARTPLSCVAFTAVTADGHLPVGDEARALVARVAAVCRLVGRASDAIGRLGTGEFGVVAAGTAEDGALRLVERLRAELARSGDAMPALHVRAGYFAVPNFAEGAVDPEEALLRASTALREAKAVGATATVRSFDDLPLTFAR